MEEKTIENEVNKEWSEVETVSNRITLIDIKKDHYSEIENNKEKAYINDSTNNEKGLLIMTPTNSEIDLETPHEHNINNLDGDILTVPGSEVASDVQVEGESLTEAVIGESKEILSEKNSDWSDSMPVSNDVLQPKNYKNVILEDWDVEIPSGSNSAENYENVSVPTTTAVASVENISATINNNCNSQFNANSVDNNSEGHSDNQGQICDSQISDSSSIQHSESVKACDVSKVDEDKIVVKSDTCEKELDEVDKDLMKPVLDKKKNPLKYSNLIVSNQDIVEILDSSVERVCRPIIPAKDIFLSIELTKHLNQKRNASISLKKNLNEFADVKGTGNNIESNKKTLPEVLNRSALTRMEDSKGNLKEKELTEKHSESVPVLSEKMKDEQQVADDSKKGKKKGGKKSISIGNEMERTIALRQLRDEFPTTRKRSHTTKKINHIPFLASTVFEKALTTSTSLPDASGIQRRRPCYLPDNSPSAKVESNKVSVLESRLRRKKGKDESNINESEKTEELNSDDLSNSSVPVVRTYSFKRKSSDSGKDIKSALQTFVSVSKDIQDESDLKPKKPKTVQLEGEIRRATKSKKPKTEVSANKKRNLELEKLLGDEGAVRMLYDTQHKDDNHRSSKSSRTKSTLGLKKDLMLKTKLVKNAVLRLSGIGSDGVSLRGNRRSIKSEPETPNVIDSSFISSSPNVVFYKQKKKQRAEASRILYRHSSSESFDSAEGCRRMSLESDVLNSTNNEEPTMVNGDLFKEKDISETGDLDVSSQSTKNSSVQRKTVRSKKLKSRKERQSKIDKDKSQSDSNDLTNTSGSKLIWSNVPVRKSSRPRMVSKKYSIWSSTSMDSLSVESLGLKKPKKASQEFAKKLNYKELRILQHEGLVQIILATSSTVLKSSFNEQVLMELKEALDFLSDQESCSAVLLTSNGTTFCQGIDLNYVLSVEEYDRKDLFGNLLHCLKQFILCLANFKKPIIAGVHAGAIGLGVTILSYCDIVICSETASFYTPYARLGQISEGAATVTFPRISRNLVTELLWKSEKISAVDAVKYGLVSQIIPEDRFEDELMMLSRRISQQSSQSMQSLKSLLNQNDFDKIEETLDVENRLILEHWCTNECINNIIKFLNSGEVQFRHLDVT